MYALKRAIEAVYQLESSELAVEPLPGRHRRPRLVAAAVLRGRRGRRRRAPPAGHRRRPARHRRPKSARAAALRPRHRRRTGTGPRTPSRTAPRPATTACCPTATSGTTSTSTATRVIDLLRRLMPQPPSLSAPAARSAPSSSARLDKAATATSKSSSWTCSNSTGYRLPDEAQQTGRRLLRPARLRLPHRRHGRRGLHRRPRPRLRAPAEKDEQARMKLEDEAGWLVLRFHHGDADDGWLTTIPTTPASSASEGGRMTVIDYPAGSLVNARGRDWLVLPGSPDGHAAGAPARAAARTKPPCCCPKSTTPQPADIRPAHRRRPGGRRPCTAAARRAAAVIPRQRRPVPLLRATWPSSKASNGWLQKIFTAIAVWSAQLTEAALQTTPSCSPPDRAWPRRVWSMPSTGR